MKKITVLLAILFCIVLSFAQVVTPPVADSLTTGGFLEGFDFSVIGMIAVALTIVFAILALIFGKKYTQVKGLIQELIKLIVESIKDNKIATQELNAILLLIRQIKQAINAK